MTRRALFYPLALLLACTVALAYSNHFQNSFHFDDSHVIEQNIHIRNPGNIPSFFADATTFSALPANQSYRPVLTTLFALEYWAGGGSVVWFHLSAFLEYGVLGVLLFFLFAKVFDLSCPGGGNDLAALLAASFYMLHTANAETVNYVSARSDLLSTLLMTASLLLYAARPAWRRFGFYLVPAALAMLTKEVSAVLPLLLLSYLLLEEKLPIPGLFKAENRKELLKALVMTLPCIVVCVGLLALSSRMLPKTYTPSTLSRLEYVLAQPFVIVHYFISFFLPFNLSADTDWEPMRNVFDDRVLVGVTFIVLMAGAAVFASRKDRTRPIALGILWFFIGVLPPSSGIVPLAEVMNDHRMFLPFIGLTTAVSWSLVLWVRSQEGLLHRSMPLRVGLAALIAVILAGHAYGTYQRNEVWKDEESLWYDVTQKSPRNARGLMNYGLALMKRGDIRGALHGFEKGLVLSPHYAYLHINTAIARDSLGETATAESHFKKAMECDPRYFGCYYYYARFLHKHDRLPQAATLLERAVELAPGFSESRYLLMRIHTRLQDWKALGDIVEDTLKLSPEDPVARSYGEIVLSAGDPVRMLELAVMNDPSPENYLWLSLAYHQNGRFRECIETSNQALKRRPDSAVAYNNICSAHIHLGEKSMAMAACEMALAIDAHFELARNNLELARGLE